MTVFYAVTQCVFTTLLQQVLQEITMDHTIKEDDFLKLYEVRK